MSNGKGLVILALLFGVSGLGLGTYSVFIAPELIGNANTFGIQNTWFAHDPESHETNPSLTNIIIDNLTIDFFVFIGEYVYILFNAQASLDEVSTANIFVYLVLDGIILGNPNYPQAIVNSNNAAQIGPITLQVATNRILSGSHNITICIYGTETGHTIQDSTLLVQTYIP